MNIIEGSLSGKDINVAIVLARFNELVTDSLCKGAISCLEKNEVDPDNITVVEVPGAFEIPGVAKKLAQLEEVDVVICIGAVIRGETPHFEQIVSGTTSGMVSASLDTGVPIINAILTCNTVDQAMDRAGLKSGNKGFDAASVAIEMANLYKRMNEK